ncbi:MAG: transcriptional activator RfaH [Proteobacteria bacterium]|nr:transcriptional activator RfaH [Pseudomonadota bacterium]
MISWCVAYTQPLKEPLAKQNLLNMGYEVYAPRFAKIRRHAGKAEEILAPLFPRYIFVGMDLECAQWRSVNGARGVSHLLMSNDLKPAQVPCRVIDELRAGEVRDGVVLVASLVGFVKGEKVRILDGAFSDQLAIFESMDDKSRAQLLLTFMGREMKMTLPTCAVGAA